jgi:phage head maturation protease
MHKLERRNIKATEIRIAPGADGSQILTGYAVRFNSPSVDLGGFTEICAPGMFTRTLRDSPDVLMLRDHNSSQLLGRTTAGTLTLTQDSTGLAFKVTLPDSHRERHSGKRPQWQSELVQFWVQCSQRWRQVDLHSRWNATTNTVGCEPG